MKKIGRHACFLLTLLATTGAASNVKGNNNTISNSNLTVILTPSNVKNSNTTITANRFGYLYTWPSNNGILSGGNATVFLTSENFSSCVQTCHRMSAEGGMYDGKTNCTCLNWSGAKGSTCLTSATKDKGLVFSVNPKPNNCSPDSNYNGSVKQDRLQLLPDFVLTFNFHLPQAFDPIISLTDSDEKLLTRRVQLHLADMLKESNNDFASYVYMKPTSPILFPSAHNMSIATINRKFSGYLKNAQSGTDINNVTSEAFQPNNIYGSQFLVSLLQDSFAATKEPNSGNDSASVLKYLYSFSFSITSPLKNDDSDSSVLVRAGNIGVSNQSSTTSLIITISLICGAFAFGLMIGGFLLLIRLNNRRDYGKLPIVAHPKFPHNCGSVVGNDLGLNDSKGQHSLSGCNHSSAAKLKEYKEEDEDEHVFIEIPSLKENRKAEYRQGSVPSLEATERCNMIERSFMKANAPDEASVIKSRHQNDFEDIRSEAVEVSECGIGDYYALLEDLDLHENLVLEDTECYQSSSFYKHDQNSFDNHTNDSSTAHPSVCSLEKIIVNAKVESDTQGSSSSSSGGALLKVPKTPGDVAHDVPIKMIEVKPSIVSPASVICEIPDSDDVRSDEKENSAKIFESVWNESDDETLQSYIPRIIQIPNVPSQEEDQEVFSPPQIRRQEFALHSENVHQTTRELPDNEDAGAMKLHYIASNDHEGISYTKDSEKDSNLKTDCQLSLINDGISLRASNSLILEIAEKCDSDGDSSAVMFSSLSYQASFIHGSTCREAFPNLLPKMVRGYYDNNSIASISDGSQSDENCGLVSCMVEKEIDRVNNASGVASI